MDDGYSAPTPPEASGPDDPADDIPFSDMPGDSAPVEETSFSPELPAVAAAPPFSSAAPPPTRPVSADERFASLDVLRGAALLGILMVNMGAFAMVNSGRYFPQITGDGEGFDLWSWRIAFFGADTKFIQMFTMLFGAGIAVMFDRARGEVARRGAAVTLSTVFFFAWCGGVVLIRLEVIPLDGMLRPLTEFLEVDSRFILLFLLAVAWAVPLTVVEDYMTVPRGRWLRRFGYFHRRMLFLLGLGLFHTFVIWDGDILLDYALFGFAMYFLMWIPWPLMIPLALSMLWLEGQMTADHLSSLYVDFGEESIRILGEGTYRDQLDWRLSEWRRDLVAIPTFFMFQAIGHMLLGVAAYRSGFFTGRWSTWVYGVTAVGCIGWGLWAIGEGSEWTPGFNSKADAMWFVQGSFVLSLGYCAALVFLAKVAGRFLLTLGLASMGRLALTNYLSQSLICTYIFYGFGMAQFGKWSRSEQMLLIVGIFAGQMILSTIWLRWFRFGPVEWLWRSFTYWKFQPILAERAAPPFEAALPDTPDSILVETVEIAPDAEEIPGASESNDQEPESDTSSSP